MKFLDKLAPEPIEGTFSLETFDLATGETIDTFSETNVITNEGITTMMQRLAGDRSQGGYDNSANKVLSHFILGKDTGGSGNMMSPTQATKTSKYSDIDPVYVVPTIDMTFNALNSSEIEFSVVLDGDTIFSQPNYQDAGILQFCSQAMVFSNNRTFSYKRFPQAVLTNMIGIRVTWSYKFKECED